MLSRRHLQRGLAWMALAIVAVAGALAALALLSPDRDPHRAIARRRFELRAVLREPRPDLGARVERWRLAGAGRDTLTGLWRAGTASPHDPRWTVVLLGGIGTNDRAALLVPPDLPVDVLAMSWPWRGPRRMSTTRFLFELPAIREAVLRSPAVLAAGAEAVTRESPGGEVALLGASLGAASAIAALSIAPDARALIVLDGGAPLHRMVRHELARLEVPESVAAPAADITGWLLAPLEPRVHAAAARGRRVLLFSARADERLPAGAAEALHALLPGARVEWRQAKHIRPSEAETIAEIARRAVEWLEDGGE